MYGPGFDRLCLVHRIEHRLTKPNHPCTNGHVEHMNHTLKDSNDFLKAYNFARRLKTLKGLKPYEYICKHHSSRLRSC